MILYDTAPSPKQRKISINHCTMPKHNKLLFKNRIMSTFLGVMLLLLAEYRIGIARNQVSILHEEVSVSVVSIIVVLYRPELRVSDQ